MNPLLLIILAAFLSVRLFAYYLEYKNLAHMKAWSWRVPEELAGQAGPDELAGALDYAQASGRLSAIASLLGDSAVAVFFFAGVLDAYNAWAVSYGLGFVPSGFLFFLPLYYAGVIFSIPFSLYRTFRLEKRFGFSTTGVRLWLSDMVKSVAVSTVLLGITLGGGLWIISASPRLWWLILWSFLAALNITLLFVYPYLVAPLFNRFEPIGDTVLAGNIRELMERAGISVSRVLSMDASRRTRHTNAYFSGIGRAKRIVIYDTLLERLGTEELLAVVAHEAGHWKRRHLLKNFVLVEAVMLVFFYVAFTLLETDALNALFGVTNGTFHSKALIFGFITSVAAYPFGALFNTLSRAHESEADRYACRLTGDPGAMAGALARLSKDNLSNLYPHPLYVAFNYSHPPVVERIRRIRGLAR